MAALPPNQQGCPIGHMAVYTFMTHWVSVTAVHPNEEDIPQQVIVNMGRTKVFMDIGLRFMDPKDVDAMITMLLRHKRLAWPDAT